MGDDISLRLLTEILTEVRIMGADFRKIILQNEEETARLVAALREADAVIADLRRQNSSLQAEVEQLRASPDVQAQLDELVLASQKRMLAVDDWILRTLRASVPTAPDVPNFANVEPHTNATPTITSVAQPFTVGAGQSADFAVISRQA